MDIKEYEAWVEVTKSSKTRWMIDSIHTDRTSGEIFAYTGGESGQFVWVVDCKVIIGRYRYAIPHIGEAEFETLYESQAYSSNADAAKRAFESWGVQFLIDLVTW